MLAVGTLSVVFCCMLKGWLSFVEVELYEVLVPSQFTGDRGRYAASPEKQRVALAGM